MSTHLVVEQALNQRRPIETYCLAGLAPFQRPSSIIILSYRHIFLVVGSGCLINDCIASPMVTSGAALLFLPRRIIAIIIAFNMLQTMMTARMGTEMRTLIGDG